VKTREERWDGIGRLIKESMGRLPVVPHANRFPCRNICMVSHSVAARRTGIELGDLSSEGAADCISERIERKGAKSYKSPTFTASPMPVFNAHIC
jgi:hypothetical protein